MISLSLDNLIKFKALLLDLLSLTNVLLALPGLKTFPTDSPIFCYNFFVTSLMNTS
jgi:hypothetical protein